VPDASRSVAAALACAGGPVEAHRAVLEGVVSSGAAPFVVPGAVPDRPLGLARPVPRQGVAACARWC